MDLGDIGSFFGDISNSFSTSFKAVNAPSSVPVAGAGVPGRPGFVYGPGGSIQAVNPATGGLLPPVNSGVVAGISTTTLLLIGGVGVLAVAFLMSVRR